MSIFSPHWLIMVNIIGSTESSQSYKNFLGTRSNLENRIDCNCLLSYHWSWTEYFLKKIIFSQLFFSLINMMKMINEFKLFQILSVEWKFALKVIIFKAKMKIWVGIQWKLFDNQFIMLHWLDLWLFWEFYSWHDNSFHNGFGQNLFSLYSSFCLPFTLFHYFVSLRIIMLFYLKQRMGWTQRKCSILVQLCNIMFGSDCARVN